MGRSWASLGATLRGSWATSIYTHFDPYSHTHAGVRGRPGPSWEALGEVLGGLQRVLGWPRRRLVAILDRLEATLGYEHVSIDVDVNFTSFLHALPHTHVGVKVEGVVIHPPAGWTPLETSTKSSSFKSLEFVLCKGIFTRDLQHAVPCFAGGGGSRTPCGQHRRPLARDVPCAGCARQQL